ncbi:hypothetical protein ACJMK2_006354 [Sinanodonta woodiana]|uniref:TRIM56 n=1 Tax=Sinanodonta woodiana TaxID=1069815 RepID=A0ABD3VSW4_SINWO
MDTKVDTTFSTQDLECPICLEQFQSPKSLPCLHSFCLRCLRSHITDSVTQTENSVRFSCPVCRSEVQVPEPGKPCTEWADITTVKDQQRCDSCAYAGTASPARNFCVICKEHLCEDCTTFHQKTKALRDHTIVKIEAVSQIGDLAAQFPEVKCSLHSNEEMKFFCKDHGCLTCSTCTIIYHRACKEILELKAHSKELLEKFPIAGIRTKLHNLETRLKKVSEEREIGIGQVKSRVDHLTDEIREVRQKINALFDEMEAEVKLEGNRIYKEMSIKLHDEQQQCKSLLAVVKNSQILLNTIDKLDSQSQIIGIVIRLWEQIEHYTLTVDQYTKDITVGSVKLELDKYLVKLSDSKWRDLATVTFVDTKMVPQKKKHGNIKIELAQVVELEVKNYKQDSVFLAAYLTNDNIIVAACSDCKSKICIFGPSFDQVSECAMTSSPAAVCKVGNNKFAVALPFEKKILLFTCNHLIIQTDEFKTRLSCCGLAVLNNGDIAVTYMSIRYLYMAILSITGIEQKCFRIDECKKPKYIANITIDMANTVAYITCHDNDTLYFVGLEGGVRKKYKSPLLKGIDGLTIDREGNIYVVGTNSHNIHQLSPQGNLLQIITENIPQFPIGICFNEHQDKFILTVCVKDNNPRCCIFQFK